MSSIIFGWFGSASDKSTMMIFLTLANLRNSSGGSQHSCCRFATTTTRASILKDTAYKPLMHHLPSGRSTTRSMGLSIHAASKQQRVQPAFKLTWFCCTGSTGGNTWAVLDALALLAGQPLARS